MLAPRPERWRSSISDDALDSLLARIGTSSNAGEVLELADGARFVSLFSAARGQTTATSRALGLVQSAFERAAGHDVGGDRRRRLAHCGTEVDIALRESYSPIDPEGRGALALVHVDHRSASMAWTGQGAAYLLRDGQLHRVEEGGLDTDAAESDLYAGGRTQDAAELRMHHVQPSWPVRIGDRLVVSTQRLTGVFDPVELAELARQGACEGAAQSLATLAQVRCGLEVCVAVIEVADTSRPSQLHSENNDFGDLLASLSDVIPELARDSNAHAQRVDDPDTNVTEAFKPLTSMDYLLGEADHGSEANEASYEDEASWADPDSANDSATVLGASISLHDGHNTTPPPRPKSRPAVVTPPPGLPDDQGSNALVRGALAAAVLLSIALGALLAAG